VCVRDKRVVQRCRCFIVDRPRSADHTTTDDFLDRVLQSTTCLWKTKNRVEKQNAVHLQCTWQLGMGMDPAKRRRRFVVPVGIMIRQGP
jgi:hypothetical protein